MKLAVTLLACGIASATVISGSMASWTAATSNPGNSVAAARLNMTNNKDAAAVFTATNVKPGDTGSSTVVVTNNAGATQLPMTVTLLQDTVTTTGIEASLRFSVHDDTRNWCYYPTNATGACATPAAGAWDATATLNNLSIPNSGGTAQWAAGEAHTFTVAWQLITGSPNADQGKTGSFRLVWNGVQ